MTRPNKGGGSVVGFVIPNPTVAVSPTPVQRLEERLEA